MDETACGSNCPTVAESKAGAASTNQPGGSTINVSSGNLNNVLDIYKGEFALTYNSNDFYNGPLGQGWTHAYNLQISEDKGTHLVLMKNDGKRVYFWYQGGTYKPDASSNEYSTIVKNTDGTYIRTTKEGIVYTFNASGQLTSVVDRNGNKTELTYGSGYTTITFPSGRSISLIYASGKITEIQTPGPNGAVSTTIGYTNGNISSITQPESKVWSFVYDSTSGKMVTKTDPAGYVTTYQYDPDNGRAIVVTDTGAVTQKSFFTI